MTGFRFCYSLSRLLSLSLFCFLWQQNIHGWCPWRHYANASIIVWGSEINTWVFGICRQIFIGTNRRSRKVWEWWQQRFITTQHFVSDKVVIWEGIHTGYLQRLENFCLSPCFKETHHSFNNFCSCFYVTIRTNLASWIANTRIKSPNFARTFFIVTNIQNTHYVSEGGSFRKYRQQFCML